MSEADIFFFFIIIIKQQGGGKRIRTAGICLAKAALYQLSYTPTYALINSFNPSSLIIIIKKKKETR